MNTPDYAELHCLSNFTFLRGASHPEELVEQAVALGYRALALTDECSLAGVVRAHQAAKEHAFRLIVGSELRLACATRLLLLAPGREAYGDLAELITLGRRRAEKGRYRLERGDLERLAGRCLLIWLPDEPAGSTDEEGIPPRKPVRLLSSAHPTPHPGSDPARRAEERGAPSPETVNHPTTWLAERFPGRTWIAVELLGGPDDRGKLARLQELSVRSGLPLVAAGDVHMHERARQPLQDLLTATRLNTPLDQAGLALLPNGERHLRPLHRLARIYPPELLAESLRIAERCRFSLDELRYEYPEELVPADLTAAEHLRNLTAAGMARRWPQGAPAKVRELVEKELALIAELHYEPYFLTVHDIVRFAREQGILCQGRGSAANSAVCYALGVTEVDPARIELLFERFISKERGEPPDIDVDFEHERREEVIQYIYRKYGRDRAALTATVISYRPRSALRDAGKALGFDADQLERLARALAGWSSRRMEPQRLRETGFDPDNPAIRRLLHFAGLLLGFPRHLSQHVGGFVISRGPLARLVPIENAAMQDRTVIQWDKDDLDALGLLKVDVLALGMLSAIRRSLALLGARRGRPFTLADIPPEHPAVYRMLQRGHSMGVFQVESRAQMAMLPRLRPACFYDLVVEVAIVRPGPIQGEMVHPYLRRRRGEEKVEYPSEEVRGVLARTLGVPIFQEQVIKLAMVAGGFSGGEADRLRRAMAAWRRRGGLEPFERKLIDGMAERGYPEEFARRIFQQILGFGEYGFPESHAAGFALLVYTSAWLKCFEPAAFTAGLLNSQPMGFYAPAQLIGEARRQGVEVRPVDVRVSEWDCTLEDSSGLGTDNAENAKTQRAQRRGVNVDTPAGDGVGAPKQDTFSSSAFSASLRPPRSHHEPQTKAPGQPALRLGLRLVKGLSQAGAARLEAARAAGPFTDVEALARRARLGRRDLEALAAADALVHLAGHRYLAQWRVQGVEEPTPLFEYGAIEEAHPLLPAPGEGDELIADYASLGLSLRRHPLALLRDRLERLRLRPLEEVKGAGHGRLVRTAGIVINRQRPGTASGVIFLTLEDETGHLNVIVWRDLAERQRREVLDAPLLGVVGVLEREGTVCHLIAGRLEDHGALLGGLETKSRDFH
ncbi:error-prone DNA polymerase [Endothiovibrio diazotrophicus]